MDNIATTSCLAFLREEQGMPQLAWHDLHRAKKEYARGDLEGYQSHVAFLKRKKFIQFDQAVSKKESKYYKDVKLDHEKDEFKPAQPRTKISQNKAKSKKKKRPKKKFSTSWA
jgi:hypothetical protein